MFRTKVSLHMITTAVFIITAGAWIAVPVYAEGPAPSARESLAAYPADEDGRIHPPGLDNFGIVEEGVYRGAQPDEEGYRTLRAMGVKCVLNLRNDKDEKAEVEAQGMIPLSVPMGVLRDANRENVDRAVAIMADPANRPIYVHCRVGQDRTGVVVATYRMKVNGWTLKDAEAEMQSYGFNDLWVNLKHLLHKIARDTAPAGSPAPAAAAGGG